MKSYILSTQRFLVFLLCLFPLTGVFAQDKQVIGWIENISINNGKFKLKAKIDTGATTSSVYAKIVKEFKKNGDNWIRFQIANKSGQKVILERKVLKHVKIKQRLMFSIKRPVVSLGICIGNVYLEEKVNLSDRKNFLYPVLIGRNYLSGYFLVDSEQKFTVKPECRF